MRSSFMSLLLVTGITAFIFTACAQKGQEQASQPTEKDSIEAHHIVSIPDTTLYGKAGDFGMSTFCLITDKGDTILVTRTAEDGTDGIIYGNAQPGNRYSLITRDNNEALVCAINLTQLERHTKNYSIWNGQLILHPNSSPDTVIIDKLNNNEFVYHSLHNDSAHHADTDNGIVITP